MDLLRTENSAFVPATTTVAGADHQLSTKGHPPPRLLLHMHALSPPIFVRTLHDPPTRVLDLCAPYGREKAGIGEDGRSN